MNDSVELLRRTLPAVLPRLRRFARSLLRSPQDADDLVQTTVERALQRADQWRPPAADAPVETAESVLRGWMFGIMKNAWIDERRSWGREQQVLAPEEAAVNVGDRSSEATQQRLSIEAALQLLPAEQQLAVCLVLVEGISYKEAAAIIEVPIGTLTSRLARGRDALAAMLSDAGATA
ncbi:MAG: RNA polymerase sigma factor [Pseudomonadota bacterium]